MAAILLVLLIILEGSSLAILILETIHHFWNVPALSKDTIGLLNILMDILSCISIGILLPLYIKVKKKAKQDSDRTEENT